MIERVNKNSLIVDSLYLSIKKQTTVSTQTKKYHLLHNKKYIVLSAKEFHCLSFLSHGMRIKRIAQEMDISVRTVETYIKRAKNKRNLSNYDDLCKVYWENKILSG